MKRNKQRIVAQKKLANPLFPFILAWMKDENKAGGKRLAKAITQRRNAPTEYTQMLLHFGPALKGSKNWHAAKAVMPIDQLLTISDEAFLAVCIINYSQHWKALLTLEQEEVGNEQEDLVLVSYQ